MHQTIIIQLWQKIIIFGNVNIYKIKTKKLIVYVNMEVIIIII